MSIISKNQELMIPKSLKECYQTDSVSMGLWKWCEKVEKWGNIFFYIILVIGIILSYMQSKTVSMNYYGNIETEFSFGLFFASMIIWIIYAVLEYAACKVIVLILSSYAHMVQNTAISTKIALYTAYRNEKKETTTENVSFERNNENISHTSSGGWICKNCGTANASYAIDCKNCGEYK